LPFIFAYTKKNKGDRVLGELTCLFTITLSVVLWYFVDRPIDAWRRSTPDGRTWSGISIGRNRRRLAPWPIKESG
jgi:peptidoglycan/LPS O-acetylase OafA/YrhL